MTDAAALVRALYDKLGTWQAVTDACNNGRAYSRTYYWRIARGTLPASARSAEAIISVAREVTRVTRPRTRDTRKTVHLYPDDHVAGNLGRIRLGLTWPEMVHLWREKYEEER